MKSDAPEPVGLIAGWGSFPLEVAQQIQESGRPVFAIGLKGHADPQLADLVSEFQWKGVLKLGAQLRFFNSRGVKEIVFAGKIFKHQILYHGLGWIKHLPDWTCYRVFWQNFIKHTQDARDDTLLSAVVLEFERQGMRILPITQVAPSLLIQPGTLTTRTLSRSERLDANFGWSIARQMGGMDIGQSITVKDQMVLGVEAIEGTDSLIERTAALCPRGGFTLVKVAKPNQDMRFDVPTIGLRTVQRLSQAGGRCIVVETGNTIFVDQDDTVAAANRLGISIESMQLSSASNSDLQDQNSSAGPPATLPFDPNLPRRVA